MKGGDHQNRALPYGRERLPDAFFISRAALLVNVTAAICHLYASAIQVCDFIGNYASLASEPAPASTVKSGIEFSDSVLLAGICKRM